MVLEYVQALLADHMAMDADEITLETTFDDLGFTMHDREELALELTEHYGVVIKDDDLENFETLEDLVACVEDQL